MSTNWVLLAYALAIGLPLLLLYVFKAQAWYWHLLSLVAAFGIGLTPLPAGWQSPSFDLLIGSVFLILLVWGIGGFLSYGTRRQRHKHA